MASDDQVAEEAAHVSATVADAEAAIAAAMALEQARQAAHSPTGGDEAGVMLSDASPAELRALGMSPDVVIPDRGPLVPEPWPDPVDVQIVAESEGGA